jgi:hypothetical protein
MREFWRAPDGEVRAPSVQPALGPAKRGRPTGHMDRCGGDDVGVIRAAAGRTTPTPGPSADGRVKDAPVDTMRPGIGISLAAWVVLLSASLLPVVVGQEVLGRTVSADAKAAGAIAVIAIGLLLTVAWRPWRALRPFLWVLLALVCAQWAVYTQLDRLPIFRTSLASPWFGVSLIAEQVLNLIVAAVMVLVLFVVHRDRRAFYLARLVGTSPSASALARWRSW